MTIGTYPYIDAFGTLQAAARGSGGMADRTPDDGLVVSFANRPNNVYVAFQGSDYEIEVYDPHPGRALEFGKGGRHLADQVNERRRTLALTPHLV